MKKWILGILLISMNAFAQTDEIEKICQDYDAQIAQSIEEESPELVPHINITANLIKRAIGSVQHNITIYFDEIETEENGSETDEFIKEAVIRKVEFSLTSGSYKIDYSYYFDEDGKLILYSERSVGYSCYFIQTYFKQKTAVRIKQQAISEENCDAEEETENFDHRNLSNDELAEALWIISDSDNFKKLLFYNYELIKD